MVSAIIVAGCFGKAKDEKTAEFTVASCNDYVQLMRCVADKAGGNGTEAHAVIDQAVAAWKNLPEADLNQVCSQALETAAAYASTYEQQGCTVPNSNTTGEEVLSGTDADPVIIDTISGEVDTITPTDVTIDATTGDTTTGDKEVVNTVVNDIATG